MGEGRGGALFRVGQLGLPDLSSLGDHQNYKLLGGVGAPGWAPAPPGAKNKPENPPPRPAGSACVCVYGKARRPYRNFCIPSVARERSALMVTVNLMLFFSPKASSQFRKFSVSLSTSRPMVLHRLSMNTWEIS